MLNEDPKSIEYLNFLKAVKKESVHSLKNRIDSGKESIEKMDFNEDLSLDFVKENPRLVSLQLYMCDIFDPEPKVELMKVKLGINLDYESLKESEIKFLLKKWDKFCSEWMLNTIFDISISDMAIVSKIHRQTIKSRILTQDKFIIKLSKSFSELPSYLYLAPRLPLDENEFPLGNIRYNQIYSNLDKVSEWVENRLNGTSMSDLSEILDVHRNTIYNRIKKQGEMLIKQYNRIGLGSWWKSQLQSFGHTF